MQKGFGGHMPERRNNRIAETSFVVTVKSENLQFATAVLYDTGGVHCCHNVSCYSLLGRYLDIKLY